MANPISAEMLARLDKAVSKFVAKAWNDSAFRQRFVKDPHAVLREAGILLGSLIVVVVITGHDADTAQLKRKIPAGSTVYEVLLSPRPEDLQDETFNAEVDDRIVALFCFRVCLC